MGSETPHHLPSLRELRCLLVPSAESSRWDEGELPQAVLHLDDQTVLLRCEALLGLAVVGRRSIDETPESKAHALRTIVAELLPKDFDHPYCFVLRCLAGLEQGTAGRKREQRQEVAGRALAADGYSIHTRSVRRRVREDCWSWLFDRLMDQEVEARKALEAETRGSQSDAWTSSPAPCQTPSALLPQVISEHLVHSSDATAMGAPSCVDGFDRLYVAGCDGLVSSEPLTPAMTSLQEWLDSMAAEWLTAMGPVIWTPLPECGERFGLSWLPSGLSSPIADGRLDGDMTRRFMKRRTLLVGLPATWLLARSGTIPALSNQAESGRVTEEVVDGLAAAIKAGKELADHLGSQAVQESCIEHARLAIRLLRNSPAALRPRMAAIASEATAEVGYIYNDQGQTAAAQSYYRLAAELAHESGDPLLEAFVLANWSDRLGEAGEPDAALSIVEHTSSRLALRRNAPATLQHLALVEADTQARLGNTDASLRALDRVDQAHDRSNGTEDSPLLYWLNDDVVGYWRGNCLTNCGRLDEADALFAEALASWQSPTTYRARALVDTARLRLRQGEVDETCRVAREGLELAVATNSPRTVSQIRSLRRELQPWSQTPSVKSLDERLLALSGI